MDKRLIILIAAFCTVSVAFFVYKKFYYKHEGIRYSIAPRGVISVDDKITYQDQTDGSNRWKWDFGDGEYSAAANGSHEYSAPGNYEVKLTVYGPFGVLKNTKSETVVVRSGANAPVAAMPAIVGPAAVETGKPVKFESSMGAQGYEWRVEGDPKLAGKTEKGSGVTYAFTGAGVRTIVLKTTKPDHEARMSVTVAAPAAVAATPAPQPRPVQTMPAPPKPKPAHPATKPHGNTGLPDLDNGVEYQKNR